MENVEPLETSAGLPSCQACRRKKIKCTKEAPKCSACAASQTDCVFEDHVSQEVYSREEIASLEQRERELRRSLQHQDGPATVSSPVSSRHRGKRYVGDEVGLNLFQFMFSSSAWKSSRERLLHCLAFKPRIAEPQATQHQLPPVSMATDLVNTYLNGSHVMHPILLRTNISEAFERIYSPERIHQPTPQDAFTMFMIFAIGAVTLYRQNKIREHPYGYYLSAMRYLSQVPHIDGKMGVQNLLLVARFGIYHHIGTSLWEIARQCIRACIEMEYHLPPIISTASPELQHNQRIFWECYQLDRYSSITLGRPLAISDKDIKVELPSPISVENNTDPSRHPSFAFGLQSTSDLTVFIYCVQLRQISSRIRSRLLDMTSKTQEGRRSFNAAGEIYTSLHESLAELDEWRASAPQYQHPNCLYETQEWFNFLLEKDKLFLMRGVVNILFKNQRGVSQDVMRLWGRCATRVVELYTALFCAGRITYTRSYFQMLFHAGLSVIFCVSSEARNRKGVGRLIPNFESTLAVCGNVLDSISEKMPDARGYAVVFDSMRKSVLESLSASPAVSTSTQDREETTSSGYSDLANQRVETSTRHVYPTPQQSDLPVNATHHGDPYIFGFDPTLAQMPSHTQQILMPGMDAANIDADAMQGMDMGLSEYVWGDLNINADMWDRIEHMIDGSTDQAQSI